MKFVKKTAAGITKVTLLGLLCGGILLAGCENGASPSGIDDGRNAVSEDTPSGKGVLGEISGVLYDSVTIQPLEGATVQLGESTVTTNANGAYVFKDVIPGSYIISFQKGGFQFKTLNIKVDPAEYKTDDPFGEYEALQDQLEALKAWAAKTDIPGYADSGDNLNWTYQDGVWISGDGTTVTVTNEDGEFVIKTIKMDYTYVKAYRINVTPLAPLTGGLTGNIRLFNTPFSDSKNVELTETEAIGVDVEVWFKEAPNSQTVGYGDDGNTTTAIKDEAQYGPAKTDGEGNFFIAGLPVGVPLTMIINGFTSTGGYYFKANSQAYVYDYDTNTFNTADTLTAEKNGDGDESQTYTDAGNLYLFTEGDFAIITDTDTGTPGAPKNPSDTISLTFNKGIDPATFIASLTLTNVTVGDGQVITFTPTWSNNDTTVTLKSSAPVTGQITAVLPYSTNGAQAIGALTITGRAKDGSKIYTDGTASAVSGIPVFTAEGLKLLGVDLAPTDIPSSRVALSAQAVKLTFSKELSPYAEFKWGTKVADYTFSTDKMSVFVWTDLVSSSTPEQLSYNVTAASDPADTTGVRVVGSTYTKAPAQQILTLGSTNIYANRAGAGTITAADANFPAAGEITLTFTRNIPDTAKVRAALVNNAAPPNFTNSMNLTTAINGKVLTITPNTRLASEANLYLAVEIVNEGEVIFGTNQLAFYNGILLVTAANGGFNSIAFRVEKAPLEYASALTHAASFGGTSSEFTTVTADSITGGNIKLGVTYYVHFDRAVVITYGTGHTGGAYKSSDIGLSFEVTEVTENVLGIKVVRTSDPTAPTYPITIDLDGGLQVDGGKINTASGTFTITGLTVNQ